MPGATLPNTGIQLPELGGDSGTWDDELNDCLRNYDVHDHSPGKGARVPTAGISINADLSFAGKAATNVARISFSEVAALSSGADALFVSNSDHELYWRTAGGVNVKLTSGTSINTTLVGGIVGDYTSAGASLSYDAASARFLLQQPGSPRPWAGLATADIDLYQKAASIVNKVTLKSPAALAASYAITLPTALPASTKRVYMSSVGALSLGRSATKIIHPSTARGDVAGFIAAAYQGQSWKLGAGSGAAQSLVIYPIELDVGSVVTGWKLFINKVTTAATGVAANTHDVNDTAGTSVTGVSQTNIGNATGRASLSETGLALAIVADHQYNIAVDNGGVDLSGAANDQTYHLEVTYTEP